ncbi:MAG TPA: acyl-CoA synthetase [Thermoanaerobaculia bacterium]|nr:acyl-CoA synthetase [Thermoanaerobaculia bacterium]
MRANYADLVEAIAEAQPEAIAQIQGERRFTWASFHRRTDSLARTLLAHGLERQDKVAQYLYNGPEYLESLFGAVKAALVPVNTNYRYQDRELLYLWDNADVAAVFFQGSFSERVEGLRARLPRVRAWVWVDDDSGPCPGWAIPHQEAAGGEAGLSLPWDRSPDDLFLIYTGGTTGMPKGVMWRQGDYFMVINRERTQGPYDLSRGHAGIVEQKRAEGPGLRILPACPQMHALGLMGSIAALVNGGSVVTLESRKFDAIETLDAIDRERVNQIYLVGDAFARPLLDALDAHPGRWRLESLGVMRSSGVMWSEEVKRGLLRHRSALVLRDGLGSTEAVRVGRSESTGSEAAATATFKLGPDAAVFDDELRPVAPGSGVVGRVAVSGPIPIGYYKDPEKSAATFVDVGGRRYSIPGDYALVEADGTIRLLGRGSVCINTGGEKVFPEEVEEVLKRHPAVRDAACVGVPDARWGEAITALVERNGSVGAAPAAGELEAWVKAELAHYKAPKNVLFVDSLGRAANGKLDYRALRELAIARAGAASR